MHFFGFLACFISMIQDTQTLAKKAGETVALVIDEEGIDPLISELLKALGDSQVCCPLTGFKFVMYFFLL